MIGLALLGAVVIYAYYRFECAHGVVPVRRLIATIRGPWRADLPAIPVRVPDGTVKLWRSRRRR